MLRAAETYAQSRYGLDGVFFWPRLYLLLPDAARSAMGDARSDLERLLIISALATLFALAAAGFAVFGSVPTTVWLPSAGAGILIGVAAYRGAVLAALTFGDLVRASFDLYRRLLLTTMGLTAPATLDEEAELWKALGQQLYRGASGNPELVRFTTTPDPQDIPPAGSASPGAAT